MHAVAFLYLLAVLAVSPDSAVAKPKPKNAVLLSNVKSLTLRMNSKTSHRRVSAIPQLKCIGGNARGLYEIDVMRCTNQGSDYDDENIQWSCTANLPADFKLGSTDVICEGYDSPQDPYVLKGSCGVEYSLVLTEKGEEKYGRRGEGMFSEFKRGINSGNVLFCSVFAAVTGWILYSMWLAYQRAPARRPPRQGGFWGGGWGGGGYPFDPPPPYPGKRFSYTRGAQGAAQEGWRPGFWSGLVGGAAAGYLAGNRGERQQDPPPRPGWFGGRNDNAWGTPTRSRTSSGSSSTHHSTGFGSTTRR